MSVVYYRQEQSGYKARRTHIDSLLIIGLIAFVAGLLLSRRRVSPQPQIIYVVSEPEQSSGLGCLLPLLVIGFVLFVVFAVQ